MTSVPGETWSVFSARVVRSRPWSRLVRRGLVQFLGLTGHHDPAILQEAMRRFPLTLHSWR